MSDKKAARAKPRDKVLIPLVRPQKLTPAGAIIAVAVVAIVGILALYYTHAAANAVGLAADSGRLTGQAELVANTRATDGKLVQFGTAATGTATSGSCPSGQASGAGTCLPAPAVPLEAGKSHWSVAFDDEFNGTSLNTAKFTPCFDWNTGGCTSSFNSGLEHYEPSQVQVYGGLAHLIAQPLTTPISDSACYGGRCTYKSGLISTARPLASNPNYLYKFTYGYVEARLKPLTTQGFFAAFWMLPATPTYKYNYEIDILEQLGVPHPKDMEMHYYYNGRGTHYTPNGGGSIGGINNNNGACPSIDYGQAFHTYGVDWEPNHIAFYIDGIKCGQFNGTAGSTIIDQPMQIILDQMVSNSWQRAAAVPLTNHSLTSDLQVDYIRVYQQH